MVVFVGTEMRRRELEAPRRVTSASIWQRGLEAPVCGNWPICGNWVRELGRTLTRKGLVSWDPTSTATRPALDTGDRQ